MKATQCKRLHKGFPHMRRAWQKPYFYGYRIMKYMVTLVKKRRFLDAHEASSMLNVLLDFFDRQHLEQEIKRYAQSFAYLLEPSSLYLQGQPGTYFTSDEILHEGWIYALDHEETQHLLELYQNLRELNNRPEQALQQWMEYLTRMKLERMDSQRKTVKMSFEVRKRYDNTIGLADGDEVEIELHPWRFGSNLIASGMVRR